MVGKPDMQRANNRGFTLIELLVVVAIIMLLAAMLLPALKSARAAARGAHCLSNLRQVASALYLYADEYKGTMPAFHNGTPQVIHWQAMIGIYYLSEPAPTFNDAAMKLRSVLHCPADTTVWAVNGLPSRNVAINGTMCEGLVNWYGRTYPQSSGATLCRMVQVQSPTELCLIGDGPGSFAGGEWNSAARYYDIGVWFMPVDYFVRHNGSMNFVMLDGHATHKSQGEVQNILDTDVCGRFFDWCATYQ